MPQKIYVSRSQILKHIVLRNTLLHLPNGVVYDLSKLDLDYPGVTDNFAIDGYFLLLLEISKTNLLLFQSILDKNKISDVSSNFFWYFLGYIHNFSLPDYKLETINWIGNNEIEYHYPYKISFDKQLSISLYDTHDMYFQSFIQSWLNISIPFHKSWNFYYPKEYRKDNVYMPIKANICIAITDPLLIPRFTMLFTGVFPTNSNLDVLGTSIDDIKLRTFQVSFSFDRLFIHPEITNKLIEQVLFIYLPDSFEKTSTEDLFIPEEQIGQSQETIPSPSTSEQVENLVDQNTTSNKSESEKKELSPEEQKQMENKERLKKKRAQEVINLANKK